MTPLKITRGRLDSESEATNLIVSLSLFLPSFCWFWLQLDIACKQGKSRNILCWSENYIKKLFQCLLKVWEGCKIKFENYESGVLKLTNSRCWKDVQINWLLHMITLQASGSTGNGDSWCSNNQQSSSSSLAPSHGWGLQAGLDEVEQAEIKLWVRFNFNSWINHNLGPMKSSGLTSSVEYLFMINFINWAAGLMKFVFKMFVPCLTEGTGKLHTLI